MYTASTAFLEALAEAGVSYIFANLGSDHPAIVEALAEAQATGRNCLLPQLLTCPNEMVGMHAAQGFAQVSGKPQAVLVHVECGTQSRGGAGHNAAQGRGPMRILAGASPFTQDGEMRGSRNEFIQWIQDVFDQRGIVRGYMKYDNELKTGKNVKQMVHRALQFAKSEPRGPVYLMGAREVMEEELDSPPSVDAADWQPIAPAALHPDAIAPILDTLCAAKRPLVVTSYLGRNPSAVGQLVLFCMRLGIGVVESVPSALNFPHDHPLYLGNQWNEPHQNEALAAADVILVIDSDVPWIPSNSRPRDDAMIFHIDVDPLKEQMPLWHIAAQRVFRADATTALRQLNCVMDGRDLDSELVEERRRFWRDLHDRREAALDAAEKPANGHITAELLTAAIRKHVDDDTIVLNEGITNYPAIQSHMRMSWPGSIFASGGGSLGWSGGAAIGAKLAAPEKTVMALCGDGSYMFSQPSTVHWMARRYETPFLSVVYNNGGWKAPRFSALAVHPDGYASRSDDIGVSFEPSPDYSGIAAAAGGAFARKVEQPEELDQAVADAMSAVRDERRSAVLDVRLAS